MSLELNESNFLQETSDGLVLVDFHAPWCGPCRQLTPVLEQLENVKVVKVNVDDSPALAAKFNVSSIPKMVFLKDGQEVDQFIGLQSKTDIQNKINNLNAEQ